MPKGYLYIAGPISGTTDYHKRFGDACLEVVTLGYIPVSPVRNGDDLADNSNWQFYMKRSIRELLETGGVYCLRDWHQSRGARIEHFIADALGLLVLYQPEEVDDDRSTRNPEGS